jgi:hypothetical protein
MQVSYVMNAIDQTDPHVVSDPHAHSQCQSYMSSPTRLARPAAILLCFPTQPRVLFFSRRRARSTASLFARSFPMIASLACFATSSSFASRAVRFFFCFSSVTVSCGETQTPRLGFGWTRFRSLRRSALTAQLRPRRIEDMTTKMKSRRYLIFKLETHHIKLLLLFLRHSCARSTDTRRATTKLPYMIYCIPKKS